MSAVDQLLVFLVEDTRNVFGRMVLAGYTENEIRQAWVDARAAGYTEATGLGQDRLTEAGRQKVNAAARWTSKSPRF